MSRTTRRSFLTHASLAGLAPAAFLGQPPRSSTVPDTFPAQPLALVQEMVGASHGNVARVKELVAERPALARAAYDWGYGDWETALGAASHVGNKEIAELLLANGAHPTIFSAAMLGQLDVVKAFVAARPGVQKTRGPHGITLLNHAKAGGAAEVIAFLESVGDANISYQNEPIDPKDLIGSYAFGPGPNDAFVVSTSQRGALMIKRTGASDRNLFHHGGRVFNPAGAEAVRIAFLPPAGRATSVTIADGPLSVSATRS